MLKKQILLATVVFFSACAPQPYKATNKVYRHQTKHWADVLKEQPGNIPVAAVAAPEWVGTTNFNLRKPNYVIIHHTAQNFLRADTKDLYAENARR